MSRRRQRGSVARRIGPGACLWACAWLALLAGARWPIPLAAHAELLRTEPAAGSVLPAAPSQLRLWFSEPVDPPSDAIVVVGPDGARADRRDSRVVPGEEGALDVSIAAQAQGTYVVRWRAISADSHPISGEFRFSVGQPSESASSSQQPVDSPQPSRGIPLQASARWLNLLGLALLVGPLVLLVLSEGAPALAGLPRLLWRGSAWASLLLVAASLASLTAQSAAVAGSVADGLQPAALNGLVHTRWGTLWIARAVLLIAVAALTHMAAHLSAREVLARWWLGLALLVSVVLIGLTTLNSHSAATTPVWLSVAVDWAHVAATVGWIGGLFSLTAVLLPAARRLTPERRQPALGAIVSRFSVLALVSVEVLVVTGLYHTWAHVSGPGALVSTAYGRTLLVKLLLVGAMMMPAAYNLLVARRRIASARGSMAARDERRFAWAVGAESALGVAVLAAVGLLTSLPPAQTLQAASPTPQVAAASEPTVTLAAPAGRFLVTLAVGPGRIGSNHLDVRVQDERGGVVTNTPLKLRITPPSDSQIPPWVVAPSARGDHQQATVALAPGGRWSIDVEVQGGSEPFPTASFPLSVPMRGAGELLAASVERMNALRSVEEDVDMLMDGVRSVGHASRQGPLNYNWLASAADVVLLRRDSIDGEECAVVSYVDTRDGARVQVWTSTATLLVVQRTSAVPGHVHTSRFSHFRR